MYCLISMYILYGCMYNLTLFYMYMYVLCCAQSLSRVRLCGPMDCGPPGSSVHGILQARILENCHALLQVTFPTQGWNPGLPYCRQILYHLCHQGSPCVYIYMCVCVCVCVCIYIYIMTEMKGSTIQQNVKKVVSFLVVALQVIKIIFFLVCVPENKLLSKYIHECVCVHIYIYIYIYTYIYAYTVDS